MLPVPKKLLRQGVRDMVRISDARMSGTSYGTCVLHVAPALGAFASLYPQVHVDLVLDAGVCGGEGATTVDITEPYWRVIKEGAISEKELRKLQKHA